MDGGTTLSRVVYGQPLSHEVHGAHVSHLKRVAFLLAGVSFGAFSANATDGIWTGATTNEWTTGTNWSSSPTVPDNTATFTNNGAPTSVTINNNASINTIQFDTGAPAYSFTIIGSSLFINGAGIVNNSSFAPSFTIGMGGGLDFLNSSTAGSATIINNNFLEFAVNSTAGNATITTNNGGSTLFFDTSTGGQARFITNAGGKVDISSLASTGMTAGSIEGAGNYVLGSKTLTVGGNGLSTTVSGVISAEAPAISPPRTSRCRLSLPPLMRRSSRPLPRAPFRSSSAGVCGARHMAAPIAPMAIPV
jgi:hypothetical protein